METADRTIRYLFVLAILFLLLAYYVGAQGLGKTIFGGINQLGLTFTGRNAQGKLAGYAK